MNSNIPFDKGMIIRTVILAVALLNQLLVNAGYSPLPFEDESVEYAVTTILTVSASLWAWWKNNAVRLNARKAERLAEREGLK